jgi:hypothetical protein
MQVKIFYIRLAVLTAIVFGLLYLIHKSPAWIDYLGFSMVGLGIMVVYNIFAFGIANILIKSRKKNIFINFIVANILFKIALVMFYILGYVKMYPPKEKFFVLPFIGIYLVFAVFETYFLYQMVIVKQRTDEQI